ncbi:hypothetical protein DYBT9275_01192 [Dyadobacter sp. CECT 9275]|uniref:Por secretion system C-terminal sorting domain-containing protein n=1 Tax=Dyadobacter helix TaxID=2822344 RepID=A0A916J8W3_9BACT|nr:hypothetical protein [Dyadobacter sp. CECT 9275]CAG4993566.1 hypothetical protein DYBT9275_01192 [Dyadobacter sp. CECT 9275]
MKKILFSIAILMGVSIANLSAASSDKAGAANVEIAAIGELKFKLSLEDVKDKSSVQIKDENGEVLYSANLPKSANYTKIFDFSTLKDGGYVFVINNGKERIEKPFSIETQTTRVVTPTTK